MLNNNLERPFNHPVEVGVRVLYILNAFEEEEFDLQRLLYLDYLLVHSADADGPPSLHAPVPFRTGEWLVRRKTLETGLSLMFAKELAVKMFTDSGISYKSSELTGAFIKHLRSEYASSLSARAAWLRKTFQHMSEIELKDYMTLRLAAWRK